MGVYKNIANKLVAVSEKIINENADKDEIEVARLIMSDSFGFYLTEQDGWRSSSTPDNDFGEDANNAAFFENPEKEFLDVVQFQLSQKIYEIRNK